MFKSSVYTPADHALFGECSVMVVWSQIATIPVQLWLVKSVHDVLATAHASRLAPKIGFTWRGYHLIRARQRARP